MSLTDYRTLGRSGLRVSPLCLGTMTFGTEWGWGSPAESARSILFAYLDAGGNFIDTANGYTNGTSETLIGQFLKERGNRDNVVIATKYTFNTDPKDPNAGGSSRKNMFSAIEKSLRRLQTDYVDLYWVHNWDMVTPVEEVLSALTDLVRAGKIRYIGLSNHPAWYVGRAQTLAELKGYERIIGLQMEYSLAERSIEREFVPAALELGMGICPWSPMAGGLLSGKYKREASSVYAKGEGRLEKLKGGPAPLTRVFSDRNWKIAEAVSAIAQKAGRPAAQIALNWVANQPGIDSAIIGATKLQQLHDNIAALDFTIPTNLSAELDEISRPEVQYPYNFFTEEVQAMVTGQTKLERKGGRSKAA